MGGGRGGECVVNINIQACKWCENSINLLKCDICKCVYFMIYQVYYVHHVKQCVNNALGVE